MNEEKELQAIDEQIKKLKEKKKVASQKIKERKEKEFIKNHKKIDAFLSKHFNEMSEQKWNVILKFLVENETELISRMADEERKNSEPKIEEKRNNF